MIVIERRNEYEVSGSWAVFVHEHIIRMHSRVSKVILFDKIMLLIGASVFSLGITD